MKEDEAVFGIWATMLVLEGDASLAELLGEFQRAILLGSSVDMSEFRETEKAVQEVEDRLWQDVLIPLVQVQQ